jgi:hypothetical protein
VIAMGEVSLNRLEYNLLYGLLIYMPLHYFICEVLLRQIKFDNIIRDIIILILFFITLIHNNGKIKKTSIMIACNCIIIILFAITSWICKGYPETLNIMRTYIVPMLIYFTCSHIVINQKQLKKMHNMIAIELAIIGFYGFFQAFFLGDDFIIKLGYPSVSGFLSSSSYYIGGFYGYQRSVGTFISPNICGLIVGIALCILTFNDFGMSRKFKTVIFIMAGIGILATFSRSAILGYIFAVLILYFKRIFGKKFKTKIIFQIVMTTLGLFILIAVVDKNFLNGLMTRMLQSSFYSTVSGSDSSAAKHIEDLVEPLNIVFSHPFGLWFGNNGPMAVELSKMANTVESSIYLMMYELGIVFGLLFFVPCISVIIKTLKNQNYKYYVPAAVCILTMVTFLLLPNVQAFEPLFYLFVFIGFYNNQNVKEIMSHE